jgi:hypothetical protein
MLSKLRSAEARDRVEAAMALGSETPPGRIVLVREALREAATGDLEPEVRQRATEALRALRAVAEAPQRTDVELALRAIEFGDALRPPAGAAVMPATAPASEPTTGPTTRPATVPAVDEAALASGWRRSTCCGSSARPRGRRCRP